MSDVFDFCPECDMVVGSYVKRGLVRCGMCKAVIGPDAEGWIARQNRAVVR